MLKYFISLLLLATIPAHADEFQCVSGRFSWLEHSVEQIKKANYCYSEDKAEIVSKNCRDQSCSAYKVGKRFYPEELLSPIGTPGFRLCRELGAEPEIVSFEVDKEFYETDRCTFPNGAFVSTDLLLDFYLDRSAH